MNLIQLYEKIKARIEAGGIIALVLRLCIGAFLGLLSGSTVLGFISKYGLFFFALRHGARIPVEGLDILSPAVTLYSFVLSISVSILVLTIYVLTYLGRKVLDWLVRVVHLPRNRWQGSLLSLVGAIVSGISSFISFTKFLFDGELAEVVSVTLAIVVVVFTFFILTARYRGFFIYLVVFSSLSFILTASIFVLQPSNVARFLRATRFGGEVDVSILLTNDGVQSKIIDGQLFLRTSSSLFIYNREPPIRLKEIPLSSVETITYEGSFTLPESLYR